MINFKKAEGARLNAHMVEHGISIDDLLQETQKRPDYLQKVIKGIYPLTRPICKALDALIGVKPGTTFDYCTNVEVK